MKHQIDSYKDTGKLPSHPYLPCITEGCESKTTCFGKNLESKIEKAGSLSDLLITFKCRDCRTSADGVRVVKTAVKTPRKVKATKADTRAALIQEMITNTPKMNLSIKRPVAFLRDSPDLVRTITTNGSCLRPDIFLNAGRKCDDCCYNNNCQSSVKTYSKNYLAAL